MMADPLRAMTSPPDLMPPLGHMISRYAPFLRHRWPHTAIAPHKSVYLGIPTTDHVLCIMCTYCTISSCLRPRRIRRHTSLASYFVRLTDSRCDVNIISVWIYTSYYHYSRRAMQLLPYKYPVWREHTHIPYVKCNLLASTKGRRLFRYSFPMFKLVAPVAHWDLNRF